MIDETLDCPSGSPTERICRPLKRACKGGESPTPPAEAGGYGSYADSAGTRNVQSPGTPKACMKVAGGHAGGVATGSQAHARAPRQGCVKVRDRQCGVIRDRPASPYVDWIASRTPAGVQLKARNYPVATPPAWPPATFMHPVGVPMAGRRLRRPNLKAAALLPHSKALRTKWGRNLALSLP